MASEKFPINSDIDYRHTLKNNDLVLDLTTLDWYGIMWFYRTKQGSKVSIGAYEVTDVEPEFESHLEATDEVNGIVTSHIQRADMSIPAGVKIYWQPYTKVADASHDVDFHGVGCEVEAGVSCDANIV